MGLSKLQQQLKKKEKERKDAAKKGTPSSTAAKAKSAADAQTFICQARALSTRAHLFFTAQPSAEPPPGRTICTAGRTT